MYHLRCMVMYLRLARTALTVQCYKADWSPRPVHLWWHWQSMKYRYLRMFDNENQHFELGHLPSGRYQTLKTRVTIRSNCYRANAIKYMNALLSSTLIRLNRLGIYALILYHSTFIFSLHINAIFLFETEIKSIYWPKMAKRNWLSFKIDSAVNW